MSRIDKDRRKRHCSRKGGKGERERVRERERERERERARVGEREREIQTAKELKKRYTKCLGR